MTTNEIEAKMAALEERIAFLSEVTDNLEMRFDLGVQRWEDWVADLKAALGVVGKQIDRLRQQLPGEGRR